MQTKGHNLILGSNPTATNPIPMRPQSRALQHKQIRRIIKEHSKSLHLILWQQQQPTIHPAKLRQRRRSLQIPYHLEARALNKTELTVSTNGSVPSSESNVWYSYQKGVFAFSFEYFGLVPYTTVPNCITAHFHQWTLCKMISICTTSSTTACHFCF